jgi:hypothetical protein
VLEALRGVGRFPDAAIDLPLEPELGVVDDERPPDEDVEQRRDILAVNTRSISDDTLSLSPAVSSVISASVAAGVSSCGTWKKTKSSSFGKATISFDVASALFARKSRIASPVVSRTLSSFSQP